MLEYVRGFKFRIVASHVAAVWAGWMFSQPGNAREGFVEKVVLEGKIEGVSAGMLERALAHENSDGAAALLVEMNTPGGLVDSMRTMAGAILSSRVPVIVYVAPAGARAGSAGFFLLGGAGGAAGGAGAEGWGGAPGLCRGAAPAANDPKGAKDRAG